MQTHNFDIDIDLKYSVLMATSDCCTSVSQDEFSLDIKYTNDVIGDPKSRDPLLGLSGPFGITCSNTCGVLSGCAGSGCGGATCTCTQGCTNGCSVGCITDGCSFTDECTTDFFCISF